jgi:hypothetical protein
MGAGADRVGGWNRPSSRPDISLAARHELLAIYLFRYYAAGGGLIGSGPDTLIRSVTQRCTLTAFTKERWPTLRCQYRRRRVRYQREDG